MNTIWKMDISFNYVFLCIFFNESTILNLDLTSCSRYDGLSQSHLLSPSSLSISVIEKLMDLNKQCLQPPTAVPRLTRSNSLINTLICTKNICDFYDLIYFEREDKEIV